VGQLQDAVICISDSAMIGGQSFDRYVRTAGAVCSRARCDLFLSSAGMATFALGHLLFGRHLTYTRDLPSVLGVLIAIGGAGVHTWWTDLSINSAVSRVTDLRQMARLMR
jgi:hypothetical protein